MDVIKDIAKSFYVYYKLGEVSFGLQDISVLSMEQAYQCQDAFLKLRENDGDQPFGYKVGCTSAAIREQFGFDEPIYGRLMTPGKYSNRTLLRRGIMTIWQSSLNLLSQ